VRYLFQDEPRQSGYEGLNDLRVIDAIRESVKTGQAVAIKTSPQASKPDQDLIIEKPGVEKPELVNVEAGGR
jgi:hypothetical protein